MMRMMLRMMMRMRMRMMRMRMLMLMMMVVWKAINGKMKDAVVAKLCAQCDEHFSNVMRAMQKEAVKNLWDSDWLSIVSGKQAIYNGLAQYHQSKLCNEQKGVGEEIAR